MNWMQNIDRPFSCPDQADPDTKIRISIPGELAMDLERIAQASGKSLEIIHFMLIRRIMEVHGKSRSEYRVNYTDIFELLQKLEH
jgi:hypothetical protein